MSILETIKGCSLFFHLEDKEINFLLKKAVIKEHSASELIVKNGDKIDNLGIIISGSAQMIIEDQEKNIVLQDLNRLDYFGEVIFSNESNYFYSVEILRPSTVLYLDFEAFTFLFKKKPSIFGIISLNILRNELERFRVSAGLIGRVVKDGSLFVRLPVYGTGKRKIINKKLSD